MAIPELIYCADGNPHYMKIAKDATFLTGAQLPRKIYDVHLPLHFADQDFKRPRYTRYIQALRKYRPVMASVLDIMEWRRLDEYLMRAEEISKYCQETIIFVPKINGVIAKLESIFPDKTINDKKIRLGYSIKTKYGGTDVPTSEFAEWPVHLLGGSPLEQFSKSTEMNVVSCDGNYAQLLSCHCQFFYPEILRTDEYRERAEKRGGGGERDKKSRLADIAGGEWWGILG